MLVCSRYVRILVDQRIRKTKGRENFLTYAFFLMKYFADMGTIHTCPTTQWLMLPAFLISAFRMERTSCQRGACAKPEVRVMSVARAAASAANSSLSVQRLAGSRSKNVRGEAGRIR